MSSPAAGQTNPLKGDPSRCWLRVQLVDIDGGSRDMEMLVDTGSPFPIIIGLADMVLFKHDNAADLDSNFGQLQGSWVRVVIPEIQFDKLILGYASDRVVDSVKLSSEGFEGLLGLPLLRLAEYGGNADWFWLRATSAPRP